MQLVNCIDQKKILYEAVLEFLDNENEFNFLGSNIINEIKKQKISEDKNELCHFLKLILVISNNYHRRSNFYNKIEFILLKCEDYIKQNFSNEQIFEIFHKNKRIILFLLDKHIITLNEQIINTLMQNDDKNYFYPEIKPFIDESKINQFNPKDFNFDEFEQKRKNAENDNHICYLIRNDHVEEFITFINKTNMSLSTTIKPSIFETNSFLIDKEPTLIEYAAFFGSICIFQYLRLNNVELTSSLWLYSIHGRNTDIIHMLESDHIEPPNGKYEECLKESIKCHHNDIALYIQNYLINVIYFLEINLNLMASKYALRYHNYELLKGDLIHNDIFFYACYYNYTNIVKILVNNDDIDINYIIISITIFIIHVISNIYLIFIKFIKHYFHGVLIDFYYEILK